MHHKTIIIDTETTGKIPERIVPGKRPNTTRKEQLSYETDFMQFPYIVSLAWKIDDKPTKEYIINQEGREIPKEASDIHGITTEIANKSKHLFFNVISEFAQDCVGNKIIVGHNIYFDSSIIKANVLREQATKSTEDPFFEIITDILNKDKRIDTMRCSTKLCGKWPKLTELHQILFGCGFEAHNAAEDVEATSRCYQELLVRGICPLLKNYKQKVRNN